MTKTGLFVHHEYRKKLFHIKTQSLIHYSTSFIYEITITIVALKLKKICPRILSRMEHLIENY